MSSAFGITKPKPVSTHCYLVFRGRIIGLFENWFQLIPSIRKFRGALVRCYEDADQAFADWEKFEATGVVPKKRNRPHGPPVGKLKRAAAMVASQPGPIGSATFTCTAASCTYPKCMCGC